MVGRVKEIVDETADKWDIFFVEKEKQEERRIPNVKKTFKVYQKDKGKGKIGGVPSIKITYNIPPPTQDTPPLAPSSPVHRANPPDIPIEGLTHDDTNPKYKILFIMNVDTQEVNIVVDKESAEVKVDSVENNKNSEKPTHTVDSQNTEIPAQTEQPETEKPTEEKTTGTWPLESEQPAVVLIEKQLEEEVHNESVTLTVAEKLNQLEKLLKVEVQTQTNPPKENASKVDAFDGSKEDIVKVIGQTSIVKKPIVESSTSTGEFRPTNITKVILDSIKRITDCNALTFKAIDNTLPILKMIAPNCKIDHINDSLGKLDTLSKFIVDNVITIDKVNEHTIKERVEKEKNTFFKNTIKKCTDHLDKILRVLNSIIFEYKELYREACKPHYLIEDMDEEIKKTQKQIDDIGDNIIGSFGLISTFEQEMAVFEKLEKLGKEKARIRCNA